MAKLERIYTVPLGDAFEAPRNKRAPKAVKLLRAFITRHMKAEGRRIVLSENLNMFIWERSIQKPPRRVKVRLIKEESEVRAYLADEKIEEPKKEEAKKEEKPEAKKEEKAPEKKAPEKKEEKPKQEEKKAPEKKEEPPPKKEEKKEAKEKK
jgi:large subunit ribosomal protein L31e